MYRLTLFLYRLYLLFVARRPIFGKRYVPKSGPLIVVANHIADSDPWAISDIFGYGRVVRWWAAYELTIVESRMQVYRKEKGFSTLIAYLFAWGTRIIVRNAGTILVDRDNKLNCVNRRAIHKSMRVLHEHGIIGIFGEGGQNRGGVASAAFVKLARRYEALIVPIRITRDAIVVGRPIDLEVAPWESAENPELLARAIMEHINALEK